MKELPNASYPYKFDESDEEEEQKQPQQQDDDGFQKQDNQEPGIIGRVWNGTSKIFSKYQRRKEKLNLQSA